MAKLGIHEQATATRHERNVATLKKYFSEEAVMRSGDSQTAGRSKDLIDIFTSMV